MKNPTTIRATIIRATASLANWSDRPEWEDPADEILDEHLAVCNDLGISDDDLIEVVSQNGYDTLISFATEDLCTRRVGPEARNLVDDYLAYYGERESPDVKAFMLALRDSRASLYEVVDVRQSRHVVLQDRLRDDLPAVAVDDADLAKMIRIGAFIVARVVTVKQPAVTAAVLSLDSESGNRLLDRLRMAGSDEASSAHEATALAQGFIREVYSAAEALIDWQHLPALTVRWPFAPDNEAAIVSRLEAHPDMARDPDEDAPVWFWTDPQGPTYKCSECDERHPALLGELLLEKDHLALESQVREAADKALARMASVLDGLVGEATVEERGSLAEAGCLTVIESVRAKGGAGLPVTTESLLRAETLKADLERVLTLPHAELDDQTPVEAAKTKKGRKKVVRWLQQTEALAETAALATGRRKADLDWVWQQVGLTRKEG
jgi:hypothetical protein